MRINFLFFAFLLIVFVACESEEHDPNFSYDSYTAFLDTLSSMQDVQIVPMYLFDSVKNSDKIIIGLRHDVDVSLKSALALAEIEKSFKFSSTYYLLHTADYYLKKNKNKGERDSKMIKYYQKLQNVFGHEVGWHNDLVSLQVEYGINPVLFLEQELGWLRNNGVQIYGSASHGSDLCYAYGFHNHYFFSDYNEKVYKAYPNNFVVSNGTDSVILIKGTNKQFDFTYEAYHLSFNKYYSDCSFPNGERWHMGMIDFSTWKKGDRIVVLTHPIYWK